MTQYDRNPAVAELVKRLAAGQCDICREAAPFSVSHVPYLECHHVVHLAKDGADTIENAVALCPNCPRKMQALDQAADRRQLLSGIEKRALRKASD